MGLIVAALISLDALGMWTLRRLKISRQRDVTAYQRRALAARPTLTESPLEEDAALSYKRAIELAAFRLSAADTRALGRDFADLQALEQHFGKECIDPELLLHAARCSRCNWGLTFQRPEPTDPTSILMPARFLAYCFVEEGHDR
jgi:hypothetical protein